MKTESKAKYSIDCSISSSWNYPSHQADAFAKKENASSRSTSFSFLKRITVKNSSGSTLNNVSIRFSVFPAYIEIEPVSIAVLENDKVTEIDHFLVNADAPSLYALSASVEGELTIDLVNENNEIVATKKSTFTFDPISNALSKSEIEELVASYVLPEDEKVLSLTKEAELVLKEKYDSSFGGYSYHDPNKVIEELDALYLALSKEGLSLMQGATKPLFGSISLPSQLLEKKKGNCIDFSLLLASLIEAISLRPILVFMENEVLVGTYLDESIYGAPLMDNEAELVNNASAGFDRLILIDPSGFSSENKTNFSDSCHKAYEKLKNDPSFLYAIDVYASRLDHLFPLPTTKEVDGKRTISFPDWTSLKEYSTPTVDVNKRRYLDANSPSKKNKFDYWEEKLLDLSMGNRLINMRFPASFPQILNLDSELLISSLSKSDRFSLANEVDENAFQSEKGMPISFPQNEKNRFKEFLNKKTMFATSLDGDCNDYFKNLARKANTSIEESGCNPLFLTIGLIKWFDNEKAASHGKGAIYSPLFLLPIRMPKRKNGNSYSLDYNFDDLQLNTTIFEYFRENYDLDFAPILGELPKKSSGEIDVRIIFNFVRERIQPFKGWMLLEEPTALSLFSFARFVMWNDIKTHREKMMENNVVSSLVNGYGDFPVLETIKKEELDEKLSSSSLAIPLPADSSQIEAIHASAEGASFVLDGPPGTGKSQTIANMITNALYHGKSVLFVAEKGVALDVVKRRLDTLGIGQFCLSIPSINTAKSEVLQTLGKMLDLGPTAEPESFANDSSSLDELKNSLNRDLFALHKKGKYVFSLYDAILNCLDLQAFKGYYDTDSDYASSLDEDRFSSAKQALQSLSIKGNAIGGYAHNVFLPFTSRDYSISKRDTLFAEIPSLVTDLNDFHRAIYNAFFKDKGLVETRANVEAYADILRLLQNNSVIYQDYLDNEFFVSKKEVLQGYLLLEGQKQEAKQSLLKTFNDGVFTLDASMMLAKLRSVERASFFQRGPLFRSLKKQVKPFVLEKSSLKKKVLQESFSLLETYQRASQQLEEYDQFAKSIFARTPFNSTKDVEDASARYARTLDIISCIKKMKPGAGYEEKDIINAVRHLATDGSYLFSNAKMVFLEKYDALSKTLQSLKERFEFDLSEYEDCLDFYAHAASDLGDANSSKGRLSEWTNLLTNLDQVSDLVPNELVAMYKEGKIKEQELFPAYLYSLCFRILADGLQDNNLATLNAKDTEEVIAHYKNAINDFCKTSVVETVSRITSQYPSTTSNAPSTENYQLRKLIKNNGRGVSLRQIFDHYSSLIRTLCPCFLMSPISVAQYLDINTYSFDLVIFDEASQIPTSEAIGSIARGKSVVVAGDQEQMPPTNFFMASGGNYNDGSLSSLANEDLESLLDDSIALGLPRERLSWHYRSRHETLIAFSNNKFYQNDLLTFPSTNDERDSVKSVYVKGNYEIKRGVNRKEATAVVDEIVRRLKDERLSKFSIGVVTFNEAQQNLIEDMLEKKIPSFESKTPGGETIFVKNLENVQGDERDVILFSTTYAPNEKGRLSLNFGPLSREKGERRLNVAITRAREEMVVFTSMKPSDISAEKAKNAGASYLRSFLLFAEHGVSILPNNAENKILCASKSVANYLSSDLKRLGYEADINVGSSSFKVDVAIKDQNDKNRYSLGVLVDGASYVESPTCRDRNVVEPGVLNGLGWRLIRVWSVEYFDHPAEVVKEVVKALNAKSKPNEDTKTSDLEQEIDFKKKETNVHPYAIPYQVFAYHPQPIDFSAKPAALRIMKMFVKDVLQNESPISSKMLDERIRSVFSLSRITSNIRSVINLALNEIKPNTEMRGGCVFYWDNEKNMEEYRYYRLNDETTKRDISDISFIELGNAIADILLEQGKMSVLDLYKQVSLLFGFASLKEKARKHLDLALKSNVNQRLGISISDDDFVYLKSGNA